MKPSQLAKSLRRIASKVEASSKPSRTLVARDLKRILANMGGSEIKDVQFGEPVDDGESMATPCAGTLSDGTRFSGTLTISLDEDYQPTGWEWEGEGIVAQDESGQATDAMQRLMDMWDDQVLQGIAGATAD